MSKELMNYIEDLEKGQELVVEVIKCGPIVALATAGTLIDFIAAHSGRSFDDVLEEIRTSNKAIAEKYGEFHA